MNTERTLDQGEDKLDVYKILILGNSGVGKTAFLLRYCEKRFFTSVSTTIGIDCKIKSLVR